MRHKDLRLILDSNFTTLPMKDSCFKVVPALNGDSGCVSFESTNIPGYYVRHRDGEVWLDPDGNTSQFDADASWRPTAGLAAPSNSQMVSYQASNISGNYLRHRDGVFRLTAINSDLDRADATFKRVEQ